MTHDDALDVLHELLALDSGLTGWEMDFIESLNAQCSEDDQMSFSEKQIAVLEKLEARLLR